MLLYKVTHMAEMLRKESSRAELCRTSSACKNWRRHCCVSGWEKPSGFFSLVDPGALNKQPWAFGAFVSSEKALLQ